MVKFLSKLNKSLRHAAQFHWTGTFSDLKNGGDEFAREVLEDFLGDEDVVRSSKRKILKITFQCSESEVSATAYVRIFETKLHLAELGNRSSR